MEALGQSAGEDIFGHFGLTPRHYFLRVKKLLSTPAAASLSLKRRLNCDESARHDCTAKAAPFLRAKKKRLMSDQPKRDDTSRSPERSTPDGNHTSMSADTIAAQLDAYRRQRRARMTEELRRARHRELPSESIDLIRFAQTWAPYGKAPREEIFVRYGMAVERFLDVLADAISMPDCDPRIAALLRTIYFSHRPCPGE